MDLVLAYVRSGSAGRAGTRLPRSCDGHPATSHNRVCYLAIRQTDAYGQAHPLRAGHGFGLAALAAHQDSEHLQTIMTAGWAAGQDRRDDSDHDGQAEQHGRNGCGGEEESIHIQTPLRE